MKLFRTLLIASLAACGASSVAHAQASASVSATGSVTIFRPITLAKNTDLSFGTLVRPGSGSGTVVIAQADGARTFTGTVALLSTGPNAAAGRATYTVNGEGGQTFSITVPANFTMTRTGGAETIVVTLAATSPTGTLNNALGAAGSATFGVGGTMPVTSTTATGAYTGTFSTTVAYN